MIASIMLKRVCCFLLTFCLFFTSFPTAAAIAAPINNEDIIYFVLTDRWMDGDTTNNQDVDRSKPTHYHGGDFAGIIQKIPYLQDLGVTALWVTPVYKQIGQLGPYGPNQDSSYGYHGYWFSNPNEIDPHLYSQVDGTDGDSYGEGDFRYFKDFVDAMHAAGIKVILDMVFNHTGYHTLDYVQEVLDHPSETIRNNWFNTTCTDVTDCDLAGLPDIDHDLADVRDFFIKNTEAFIDCGIDGIRLDTTKHLEDALWQDLKKTIWSKYPDLTWIGEVLLFDVDELASYQNEDGLDSVFDFAFYQAIKDTFIYNVSMERLAGSGFSGRLGLFDVDYKYSNPNLLATVTDNHDLSSRIMTEIKSRYGDTDMAQRVMKLMFGLQFTTRGIPKIYYGTEIGMEGYGDPDNRKDMDFSQQGNDLYQFVKQLVALRKGNNALKYGTLTTLYSDQYIYAFMRHVDDEETIVVINNGEGDMLEPLTISIGANSNIPSAVKARLQGKTLTDAVTGNSIPVDESIAIALPGKSIAILQ